MKNFRFVGWQKLTLGRKLHGDGSAIRPLFNITNPEDPASGSTVVFLTIASRGYLKNLRGEHK